MNIVLKFLYKYIKKKMQLNRTFVSGFAFTVFTYSSALGFDAGKNKIWK